MHNKEKKISGYINISAFNRGNNNNMNNFQNNGIMENKILINNSNNFIQNPLKDKDRIELVNPKKEYNILVNNTFCNKIPEVDKVIFNKLGNININRNRNNNPPSSKKTKNKFVPGSIGLTNIGNTCYLNSAIQILKNIYPLTLYLLINYKNYNRHGFTYKYCELIANLINQNDCQFFEPKEFFNKLSENAPIFSFGQQNDSNISILYILSLLEKETKNDTNQKKLKDIKISYLYSVEDKEKFNLFLKKTISKRNSCIIDLLYGFQEDIIICGNNNCNYRLINYQGISVLNLPIMYYNNKPIKTLVESIKYYQTVFNHQNDKDFICPLCHNYNISTQSIIISYPKHLIINFKRVGEQNFYNHYVNVPQKLIINTDNYMYEYYLIGLIKHFGGEHSGHNIAICKNFFDEKWYVYDDSSVRRLDNTVYGRNNYTKEVEIDTTKGFLFCYQMKGNIISDSEKNTISQKSEEIKENL